MQCGRLFLFWNWSIVKWCTLIGYLFLSACIFVRKFIAHSKLRAAFGLSHIALLILEIRTGSSFSIRYKGTHHDEFDRGSKPWSCLNKGWKFLKKLWCCVGGGNKVIWLYQLSWKCKLATVMSIKLTFRALALRQSEIYISDIYIIFRYFALTTG